MDGLQEVLALLAALVLANLGGVAAIWYKLGRVESRVSDHLQYHRHWEAHRHDPHTG